MGPLKKRRRRGRATEVSAELKSVLRNLGRGNPEIHPEIWARWCDIVGPDLARRTIPRRLKSKILYLAVTSSSWMHELSYLTKIIIEKIDDAVGYGIVRDIRLVLDPDMPLSPSVPPPPAIPEAVDIPLPPQIQSAVDAIGDAALKEAIVRAAKASLADK